MLVYSPSSGLMYRFNSAGTSDGDVGKYWYYIIQSEHLTAFTLALQVSYRADFKSQQISLMLTLSETVKHEAPLLTLRYEFTHTFVLDVAYSL